jgi:hypothetical protein
MLCVRPNQGPISTLDLMQTLELAEAGREKCCAQVILKRRFGKPSLFWKEFLTLGFGAARSELVVAPRGQMESRCH